MFPRFPHQERVSKAVRYPEAAQGSVVRWRVDDSVTVRALTAAPWDGKAIDADAERTSKLCRAARVMPKRHKRGFLRASDDLLPVSRG